MKRIILICQVIFFWSVNALLLLFGLPVLLLTAFILPRHSRYLAMFWARVLLLVSGFRVKIIGQENIPPRPVLIAANHTSFFDILITLGYFPVKFNFVMKKELFRIPFFGRAVKTLGYFPIDRQNARKAARSLQELALFLRNGHNVLIFPEGTRGKPVEKNLPLLPFKSGMSRIAFQAQTEVLPIGLGCAATRQKPWRLGSTLTMTIGQPMPPPISDEREELQRFSDKVRAGLESILA